MFGLVQSAVFHGTIIELSCICLFFFKDPAATEIYTSGHTLSLHDALPISRKPTSSSAPPSTRPSTGACGSRWWPPRPRSEEHTSELQSLMRISYAVFCLKKKTIINHNPGPTYTSTENTENNNNYKHNRPNLYTIK